MRNLWPDDIAEVLADTKSPVAILREQAALLGQSTQNLVKAKVAEGQLAPLPEGLSRVIGISGQSLLMKPNFVYDFFITAPPLGAYRYKAFTIEYGIDLYPVRIEADEDVQVEITSKSFLLAESETEFVEILGEIFATEKMRRVISTLLAQMDVVPETA